MAARAQQWREVTLDQLRWGLCLTPAANGAAGAVWDPGGRRCPIGGPSDEETPLTGGPHCSNFPTQQ
jgi:hypothetical protein